MDALMFRSFISFELSTSSPILHRAKVCFLFAFVLFGTFLICECPHLSEISELRVHEGEWAVFHGTSTVAISCVVSFAIKCVPA